MNDDLLLEYMLQMAAMQPQEVELLRKQKQIDALRGTAMESPQGQMVGKHYVAPSMTQYLSQLGQGYMAGQAQKQQGLATDKFNASQINDLKAMRAKLDERRRRQQGGMTGTGTYDPYSQFAMPSNT